MKSLVLATLAAGVLVDASATGISVRGDPKHPANRGALCSKGAALGETVGLQGRLLAPQLHRRDVDWGTALDAVSTGFRRIIDEIGRFRPSPSKISLSAAIELTPGVRYTTSHAPVAGTVVVPAASAATRSRAWPGASAGQRLVNQRSS